MQRASIGDPTEDNTAVIKNTHVRLRPTPSARERPSLPCRLLPTGTDALPNQEAFGNVRSAVAALLEHPITVDVRPEV